MKVLVAGAGGQVGRELCRTAPPDVQLLAMGRAELDVGDFGAIQRVVSSFGPDVVMNAAAYTAVDAAESSPEVAALVNATGPRLLAKAVAHRPGCRLVHVSTNYVFDGDCSQAYGTNAPPNPQNVYGRTKLAGERAVLETLPSHSVLLRTSWVYAAGGKNFLTTMLRLMREKGVVRVVDDQIGTPTAAGSVSSVIWRLARDSRLCGIYHWTDAGVASWYDFAAAIADIGCAMRLLPEMPEIIPIPSSDYPQAARRPPFGVLDNRRTSQVLRLSPVHWRHSLTGVMASIGGH